MHRGEVLGGGPAHPALRPAALQRHRPEGDPPLQGEGPPETGATGAGGPGAGGVGAVDGGHGVELCRGGGGGAGARRRADR